jgi:hypothetical protein
MENGTGAAAGAGSTARASGVLSGGWLGESRRCCAWAVESLNRLLQWQTTGLVMFDMLSVYLGSVLANAREGAVVC